MSELCILIKAGWDSDNPRDVQHVQQTIFPLLESHGLAPVVVPVASVRIPETTTSKKPDK